MIKPKKVSKKAIHKIIKSRYPVGSFYAKDGLIYVGVDNRTGDAWTRDFLRKKDCLRWLKGRE